MSLDGEQITVANFPVTQTVSGTVEITNDAGNAIPVSIASVPSHAVTGPLTNTELRASDVKVSLDGEQVAVSNFPATQAVSGTVTVANPGLTDAQLRASAVPVSVSGVATESTLSSLKTVSDSVLVAAQAIRTATEAFNAKAVAMNTNAVTVENNNEELLAVIRDMADTMNVQLQSLVNAITPAKARGAALSVEFAQGASQPMYIPSTIASCTMGISSATSTDLGFRYRIHEPWNNSDMGAARLYDQIKIS